MLTKKNKDYFTWEAQKSGPKGYPMKMIRATLFFKGSDSGLYVPNGTSWGKWGEGFANHPEVENYLPDRLEVVFYSYAENQTYKGVFDLPYDKLVELFQWGIENPFKRFKHSQPQFRKIVVAVAPGGSVGVWVSGPDEQREVFFGQAEKYDLSLSSVFEVPFRNDTEAETFRVEVLQESIGVEAYNNFLKEGIPFDIWQRYRKPYQWVIESFYEKELTDHYATLIDGTRSSVLFDYSQVNETTIPSFIQFYYGPKLYDVHLDDYETITAFEALDAIEGLKPEERLIHIEMTPRLPKNTSTVRLYNAKHSIELKKFIFKD